MQGGILEVLLVSAQDIRHTNIIGRSAYYVVIECGTQVRRSKTSTGNREEIYWNEKFRFEFPLSVWENITNLKLRIMDEEFFTDGGFVGETIVYLEGIIMEGNDKGFIELRPAPYNVVLEDDTYKGEIKIGLKFSSNKIVQTEERECVMDEKERGQSLCRTITKLWKIRWWRLLFSFKNKSCIDNQKQS